MSNRDGVIGSWTKMHTLGLHNYYWLFWATDSRKGVGI